MTTTLRAGRRTRTFLQITADLRLALVVLTDTLQVTHRAG
jgi:hypothetical protein